jgi:hypothetical protein
LSAFKKRTIVIVEKGIAFALREMNLLDPLIGINGLIEAIHGKPASSIPGVTAFFTFMGLNITIWSHLLSSMPRLVLAR